MAEDGYRQSACYALPHLALKHTLPILCMKSKAYWIASFSVLVISICGHPVPAQSIPAKNETLEELNRVLEETEVLLDIAEARKKIVEARRAELDAALPFKGAATTTPLSNAITITSPQTGYYPIENQILVHQSLHKVVQEISKQLLSSKVKVSTVVIHDDASFSDLALYESYEQILGLLGIGYNKILNPSPTESFVDFVEIPTAILRTAADFAALFRSEVTIDQLALEADRDAVVAQLASAISSSSQVSVFYPGVYALDQGKSTQAILGKIQDLTKLKRKADQRLVELQKSTKAGKELSGTEQKAKEQLEYLNVKYDETFKELLPSGSTKVGTFQSLSRGYQISQYLKKPDSYILYITVKASGSTQRKRSLFSSRLRHSGGVLVNYLLLNPRGEIKLSDSLYSHSGFTRMDGLRTNLQDK